ncbi:MAG: DNA topoisomerase I [Candidatus Helarchaeota archaeon]
MAVLIITEKPTACKKISEILDENNSPTQIKLKNVEYYKSTRNGKILLIVPAIGHLFTVSHIKSDGRNNFEYPVFDLVWIPVYKKLERARKKNSQYYQTKNVLDVFKKVSQVCNEYIVACDYDIEGSTIGYKILEYCIGIERIKKAKRMKFSSLTKTEIINSYKNLLKSLNFNLIESGICRHEVDYLFGINLTHALTNTTTKMDKINFFLLTTGRVQGPTLAEIVRREKEIINFKPENYWIINGILKYNGKEYIIEHIKGRFNNENEVDSILLECKNKQGIISDINKSYIKRNPPVPYNLSELQDDAYNLFKYDPSNTLKVAEKLYLDSLITYPRTSNQIIGKDINLKQILTSLSKNPSYKIHCTNILKGSLTPTKGKKTDPAHPPILPTGNLPQRKLNKTEQNIFNLVVYRFFSIFGEPATFERIKYLIAIDSQSFSLSGQKLVEKGWLNLNPYFLKRVRSQQLPIFQIGQKLNIELKKIKKQTKPPARYNPNSIRKWMEANEIGTKSTRSEIVKKLYERKYIVNRSIEPTKIGISLIEILNKYVPEILSVEMTRDLEKKMSLIETGELTKEEVITEAKSQLTKILNKFKKDEYNIGKDLEDSVIQTYDSQNTIGKCPNCDNGLLKVMYSKKTKKRFIGCTNYPNCTTAFPVSQKGTITPLKRYCKYCESKFGVSYPMIRLNLPKKRPFTTCINWSKHEKSNKSNQKEEAEDSSKNNK